MPGDVGYSHEQLPGRWPPENAPSLLHACHEVLTELREAGVDPAGVHADELIGSVAARQHRVICSPQLAALGVGREAVAWRVERKLLLALHRGVYVWGGEPIAHVTRARAALIACGPAAVVSHESAGAMSDFRAWTGAPIDVTIAGGRVRRRAINTHESRRLTRADVLMLDGIAVTTPARTLVDLAARLSARQLADALERAQAGRLVSKAAILAAMERAGRRPGIELLRALVDEPQSSGRSL